MALKSPKNKNNSVPKSKTTDNADLKNVVNNGTVRLDKLKKKELLEIMLAQGEEIDALRAQVADLEAQLADREMKVQKVGSLAEASLQVTNIFKEAEKAAIIYLDNIRRRYE